MSEANTHTVPFPLPDGSTIPPTGRKGVFPYVAISEARDGLVASNRLFGDNLDFFTQLGWPVPGS